MGSPETEKILYELGADGVCEFQDGTSIRINRTMLAMQSPFFRKEFFGPPPKIITKITDFDPGTFKTFLDCLFGLKEYTVLDSLLIYPIAHQYDVKESVKKCAAVLEPKEMNENVCVTLNLALFYKRDDLVAEVVKFIQGWGVINLLESRKYRSLLEPISVSKLLEYIQPHSFVSQLIYDWGKDYLQEHNKSVDVNFFLKENEILPKIQKSDFESLESAFNFLKANKGDVSDEIFNNLLKKVLDSSEKFPKKSRWMKLDGNGRLKETLEFSHGFSISHYVAVQIFMNEFFTEKTMHMAVSAEYHYSNISCSVNRNGCKQKRYNFCTSIPVLTITSMDSLPVRSAGLSSFFLAPNQPANSFGIKVARDQLIEVKSITVTYEFNNAQNCRILKTSLGDGFKNPDELYFTKNIVFVDGVLKN